MSPHRASTLDASSGAFYYPPRTYDATVPQPSSSAQSHMHAVSRPSSRHQSPTASEGGTKKRHICTTCDRAFTTSGHLARHARIHTGERNHKCPFPGCETRCSRQDNLQQQ
ncbi:hypothetical protein PLICRDRAFT_33291 [Plicaturopsis crispa FD-325 SS-3]|nr:hypothetical protein PLICRDRAFT_33291 [Plicaturopsis crispa FD-325 SS-3]